jgi:hypothetical protein
LAQRGQGVCVHKHHAPVPQPDRSAVWLKAQQAPQIAVRGVFEGHGAVCLALGLKGHFLDIFKINSRNGLHARASLKNDHLMNFSHFKCIKCTISWECSDLTP